MDSPVVSKTNEQQGNEYLPSVSGIKLKITDFLMVVFSGLLAFFTYQLNRSTGMLWKEGRVALQTTERAFIYLDGFDSELTTAADSSSVDVEFLPDRYKAESDRGLYITRFAVLPRWKNSGSTPTRKMKINVGWQGPPTDSKGVPIPPEYTYRSDPAAFFVAPNAVERSEIFTIPSAHALVDWGLNPVGMAPEIFIWGRADYEDVFGKEHFIEWCYRVRFDRHDGKKLRANFIQYGAYNSAQ
jgi:hypothetical protein